MAEVTKLDTSNMNHKAEQLNSSFSAKKKKKKEKRKKKRKEKNKQSSPCSSGQSISIYGQVAIVLPCF
jgi:hypothetical protein